MVVSSYLLMTWLLLTKSSESSLVILEDQDLLDSPLILFFAGLYLHPCGGCVMLSFRVVDARCLLHRCLMMRMYDYYPFNLSLAGLLVTCLSSGLIAVDSFSICHGNATACCF